jgi:hypothetical protein
LLTVSGESILLTRILSLVGKMGIWSRKGHFITQKWRLREWVVGMDDKLDLRPFVSPKVNENLSTAASIPPHSVLDYFTDFNRPDHVNEQLWDRCRERASQVAGSR